MNKEKKLHGMISDGYGKRFLIFWLYVALDDVDKSIEYIRWYENEFPDCGGEPGQLISWAVLLHRAGKPARKILAEAMLSNTFLLPMIIGEAPSEPGCRYQSNFEHPEYVDEFPERFLAAFSNEDRAWIKEQYQSAEFTQLREDYARLSKRLEATSGFDERGKILNFMRNLTQAF